MDTKNPADALARSLPEQSRVLSERVFQGGYLAVDRSVFSSGERDHVREIVRVRDGVCVLAILEDGRVPVVAQMRQAVERVLVELPAGVVDAGESPLEAARRELSEEAGVEGGTWTHLLRHAHAEGYSSGWMDLYLAEGCRLGTAHPEESEEIAAGFLTLREAYRALDDGLWSDAKSMLALHRARPLLERSGRLP